MFDPEFNARAIAARRRVTGNPAGCSAGGSGAAHSAGDVGAILASKGTDATAKQYRDLQAGLRASLEGHAGKTVERVGEGNPKWWRIFAR
jgi:hypothetical protein